jgi:hypothetical protein
MLATSLAAIFSVAFASECKRLFPLEEIGMSVPAASLSPWQLAFIDIRVADDSASSSIEQAATMFAACNCSIELSALVRVILTVT